MNILSLVIVLIGVRASGGVLISYKKEQRLGYITNAIISLRKSAPEKVNSMVKYFAFVERDLCRSNFEDLRLRCLISGAKSYCRDQAAADDKAQCDFIADLIIINRLSQRNFIGSRTRYEVIKGKLNIEGEIQRILNLRYAGIATEFALSKHFDCPRNTAKCLAAGIDAYCLETADKRNLTWQSCIGGLAWYIGNHHDRSALTE